MNERYVLSITRYSYEKIIKKEWERIADTGNEKDGKSVYGYVDREETKNVEDNVCRQEIDKANIRAIIAAANGFKNE